MLPSPKGISRCLALGAIGFCALGLSGCGSKAAPTSQEIQAFNPDPNKMSPEARALMQKNEAAMRQKQAAAAQAPARPR